MAYSAGIEAHGVNPRAIKTMAEININISTHSSDTIDKHKDEDFDYTIIVCYNAKENCPYLPSKAKRLHHNFPDSAKVYDKEVYRKLCKKKPKLSCLR